MAELRVFTRRDSYHATCPQCKQIIVAASYDEIVRIGYVHRSNHHGDTGRTAVPIFKSPERVVCWLDAGPTYG